MTSGDVPSWEAVAQEHGRFIYTVAYRLSGNRADADDLVQEVMVRVQRGLATYTPGSMQGWLARITTNAFYDETRRRKRRPTIPLPDEPDRVIAGSLGADYEHAQANLPEHVQAALLALPDDRRAVVVMCDVVGMTYDEIADTLDIAVGTVRSRIHRGRTQLRTALAADYPERGDK
jgi:RNA polymerase sigma-70 factor (ECF subfamily)